MSEGAGFLHRAGIWRRTAAGSAGSGGKLLQPGGDSRIGKKGEERGVRGDLEGGVLEGG
jgi:hypothetical protein